MMQQVNLFQKEEVKKTVPVTAMQVLLILLIAVCMMAFAQFQQWSKLKPIRANLANAELEQQRIQEQMTQLEAQLGRLKPDKALLNEIKQLRGKLARGEEILKALTEGPMSNTQGFSPYLEAVANKHIEGTWLTHINIHSGGSYLGLSGKTITPELVPEYMKNLSSESVFMDTSFNVLELQRSNEQAEVINFHVATGSNG